jgi:hypothetical protein
LIGTLLTACGPSAKDAEERGFSSVEELKAAEKMGSKNATEYALSKGFTDLNAYRTAQSLKIENSKEYEQYLAKKKEEAELERQKSAQPESKLVYKPIGFVYSKEAGICQNEPKNLNMDKGYFHCVSPDNKNYSFDSKGAITAVWLNIDVTLIPVSEVQQQLTKRYGSPVNSFAGEMNLDGVSAKVVATTFGCKAILFNKAALNLRYDTPNYENRRNDFQSILRETGYIFDAPWDSVYNNVMDFEVAKEEVIDSERCVVSSITTTPVGRPTTIGEEQRYKSVLRVLEVNPKFPLLRSTKWSK